MVFVAKQKPTHHPLNDPNLPEHLPKFQGHRSRASTKHRCIERDLKDRDESPSNLENESKIKKTPQSSAFSRHTHTHTMDWVTWMICMCQAAPSWTNHPEIRKRCAYLSHKHHHLQSKMVQSYTFIASIQNDFWSKLRSKGKHETFITFPGSSNWKVAKKRWFRLSHQRPPNKPKKQIAHLRVGNS